MMVDNHRRCSLRPVRVSCQTTHAMWERSEKVLDSRRRMRYKKGLTAVQFGGIPAGKGIPW
jgi:hypothetical protein